MLKLYKFLNEWDNFEIATRAYKLFHKKQVLRKDNTIRINKNYEKSIFYLNINLNFFNIININ